MNTYLILFAEDGTGEGDRKNSVVIKAGSEALASKKFYKMSGNLVSIDEIVKVKFNKDGVLSGSSPESDTFSLVFHHREEGYTFAGHDGVYHADGTRINK